VPVIRKRAKLDKGHVVVMFGKLKVRHIQFRILAIGFPKGIRLHRFDLLFMPHDTGSRDHAA
jgi:hypothetical protein